MCHMKHYVHGHEVEFPVEGSLTRCVISGGWQGQTQSWFETSCQARLAKISGVSRHIGKEPRKGFAQHGMSSRTF